MTERLTIKNLEIKSLKEREFEGYGSIFGNVDLGGDVVVPGAFKRSLKQHKSQDTLPMMFWMHQPDQIPGKWLEMQEDSNGLYVKGVLADTQLGRDVHTLLGMKAVRGLSIGYSTKDQDFTDDGVRLLKDVELYETSIVSIAMNPLADVTHAKSRLTDRGEYVPELAEFKRKCEQFFRDEGISKNTARLFVSNMFAIKSGETLDDPGETLESKDTETEQPKDYSGVTPDDIEINEGLKIYKDMQQAYDIKRIMEKYFNG